MTRLNNGVTLWSAATSQQVGDIEPYCPDISGLNMISVNLSLMAASSQMSWKHVINKISESKLFYYKEENWKAGDQNKTCKNLCFILVYFI